MKLDIATLYYKKEDSQLEYKEGLNKEDVASTMAAFATSKGGYILVGVKNDGSPVGFKVSSEEDVKALLYNLSKNANGGRVSIEVHFYPYEEEKKILLIRVNEGHNKPYGYGGVYYERVDSSDEKLTAEGIARIHLQSLNLTFDALPAKICERTANISDIDESKLREYVSDVNKSKRSKTIEFNGTSNILRNFDLLRDTREVKNAAILFFGKNIQEVFPGVKINFLTYGGDTINASTLKFRKLLEGSILSQIEDAFELIRANTENKIIFQGLKRIEINQYPLTAIREAIINAVAHRDYSITDSDVTIRLFENRLEIVNPGGLIGGINLEELKLGGHPSVRRNPIICLLLDNLGFMEQSGQGIKNMISAMKNVGLEEPAITTQDYFFRIEFKGQQVNRWSEDQRYPLVGKAMNLEPLLSGKQREGLAYIQSMPESSITITKYMRAINIKSRITAKSHLDHFEEFGLIKQKKIGRELLYHKSI